jgi:hypothetical protein
MLYIQSLEANHRINQSTMLETSFRPRTREEEPIESFQEEGAVEAQSVLDEGTEGLSGLSFKDGNLLREISEVWHEIQDERRSIEANYGSIFLWAFAIGTLFSLGYVDQYGMSNKERTTLENEASSLVSAQQAKVNAALQAQLGVNKRGFRAVKFSEQLRPDTDQIEKKAKKYMTKLTEINNRMKDLELSSKDTWTLTGQNDFVQCMWDLNSKSKKTSEAYLSETNSSY